MKRYLNKMSMQLKMTLAFAIPLILVHALITQAFYGYALEEHKKLLNQSMEKSVTQAASFMESYLTYMENMGEIISNNGVVQETLFAEDFSEERSELLEYFDYYHLSQVMMELEVYNSPFRLGLYISDQLTFSGNNYYFYKESTLRERKDYDLLEETLSSGKDYIALGAARIDTNRDEPVDMLTLFHPIYERGAVNGRYWVCSVSMEISRFRNIIQNSDITEEGLSYLLNARGQSIVSSNEERHSELMSMKGFLKNGKDVSWEKVNLNTVPYYAIRKTVGSDGWNLISLIPLKEYQGRFLRFRVLGTGTAIAMFFIIVLMAHLLARYYVNRLRKLKHEMTDLQGGNLNAQLDEEEQGDEIEEVYHSFNYMVTELRRLMQEHYRLGKSVQSAELRALQAQINPHFLYNTLDLINWISMDYGATEIEQIAWNLARFYRLSLNHGKSLLTIEEELEHTQVYVAIQNYHYAGKIHLSVEVPEELKKLACLNITLQPFVENCIVHGIAEHSEIEECNISIIARQDADEIEFVISDDGPGMTQEQISETESLDIRRNNQGYGIKNINFRIKLCFGDKYGVHYQSKVGEGTDVFVRIPALSMEEAEKTVL